MLCEFFINPLIKIYLGMCCLRIKCDTDTKSFITAQLYILLYFVNKSTFDSNTNLYSSNSGNSSNSLIVALTYSVNIRASVCSKAYSSIAYSASIVAGRHRYRVRIRRFRGIPVLLSIVQNSGIFF